MQVLRRYEVTVKYHLGDKNNILSHEFDVAAESQFHAQQSALLYFNEERDYVDIVSLDVNEIGDEMIYIPPIAKRRKKVLTSTVIDKVESDDELGL